MTVLGILMALGLIVDRFTVGTKTIQLGFGFVIVVIASYLYGPVWSAAMAGLTDVIGTLVSGQVYNPGFTLSAILGAIVYGWFLYGHKSSIKRIVISQLLIMLVVNLVLNTLWISLMYQTPYVTFLMTRILKEVVTTPIQIIIIYFLLNSPQFNKLKEKLI